MLCPQTGTFFRQRKREKMIFNHRLWIPSFIPCPRSSSTKDDPSSNSLNINFKSVYSAWSDSIIQIVHLSKREEEEDAPLVSLLLFKQANIWLYDNSGMESEWWADEWYITFGKNPTNHRMEKGSGKKHCRSPNRWNQHHLTELWMESMMDEDPVAPFQMFDSIKIACDHLPLDHLTLCLYLMYQIIFSS